ncbi:hypothetical protein ACDX78_13715 [Virgibacillus oceani]
MFLEKDKPMAKEEQNCFKYSIKTAKDLYEQAQYEKASMHLENAKRSLNELESMKNRKTQEDKIDLVLNQIKGTQQQRELLRMLQI